MWQLKPLLDTLERVDSLAMPAPDNLDYYQNIRAVREKYPDKSIFVNVPVPLEHGFSLRLYEGLFLDMCDDAERLEAFLMRIGEILARAAEHVCSMDIGIQPVKNARLNVWLTPLYDTRVEWFEVKNGEYDIRVEHSKLPRLYDYDSKQYKEYTGKLAVNIGAYSKQREGWSSVDEV